MKSFVSHSLEETAANARLWLDSLAHAVQPRQAPHSSAGACVVGLSGHLGAGKTAFTKAVARALGIAEEVTSPTFVIMKLYFIPHGGAASYPWKRLVHIDAYRLERREDLEALKFEELAADPGNLVMIEWPEKVGLSADFLSVHLNFEIRDGAYCAQSML